METVKRWMELTGITASSCSMAALVVCNEAGVPGDQLVVFAWITWVSVLVAMFGSDVCR